MVQLSGGNLDVVLDRIGQHQRHSDNVLWDLVRLKCLGAPGRIEWPAGLFYGEEWFWARMLALVDSTSQRLKTTQSSFRCILSSLNSKVLLC